ncbi:MAG: BLUF domain-containing protein [Pseudomonadota bacterium]
MPVDFIVYASSAAPAFTSADLDEILLSSRRNNAANGLTGLLLYADGAFIQAIEGDQPALSETFARIDSDPRHRGLQVLYRGQTQARQFEGWHMGMRKLSGSALPDGLKDLRAETLVALQDTETAVRVLLKQFYRGAFPYETV